MSIFVPVWTDVLHGKITGKFTAYSKKLEVNSSRLILVLQRGGEVRKLTSQSSSSLVWHRAIAAKRRGCGPKHRQRVTDAYTEKLHNVHCARKNCRFGNRRFCYSGYKYSCISGQICSEDAYEPNNAKSRKISKNNFADLYHLFAWTVTYISHSVDFAFTHAWPKHVTSN